MLGALEHLGASSVLDIGSGTGRVLSFLKTRRPDITVRGIEPVEELREVAYAKGISSDELTDGDALDLVFPAGRFDLVCAFGVLHHVRTPARAIGEMLRVARQGIFISDSNNFGQGPGWLRAAKQLTNAFGLWPLANFIKTHGRGYDVSAGDGVSYSYSVFTDLEKIRLRCRSVHLFNTSNSGVNPYRTASHVALLGLLP
jgi:SAM-dependent methyltransferase